MTCGTFPWATGQQVRGTGVTAGGAPLPRHPFLPPITIRARGKSRWSVGRQNRPAGLVGLCMRTTHPKRCTSPHPHPHRHTHTPSHHLYHRGYCLILRYNKPHPSPLHFVTTHMTFFLNTCGWEVLTLSACITVVMGLGSYSPNSILGEGTRWLWPLRGVTLASSGGHLSLFHPIVPLCAMAGL